LTEHPTAKAFKKYVRPVRITWNGQTPREAKTEKRAGGGDQEGAKGHWELFGKKNNVKKYQRRERQTGRENATGRQGI